MDFMQREQVEAYQLMDEMSRLSLTQVRARIRQGLERHGTNVEQNDNDPTGDGDQSPVRLDHDGKQFYRDLFATGGDINNLVDEGFDQVLTPFGFNCVIGTVPKVKEALEKEADNSNNEGPPSSALIELLETRETSMRLSPLLMVISMGKNIQSGGRLDAAQLQVVKLLLQYGARPDARDVCGKVRT